MISQDTMREALRLTKAGRLEEAMKLLKGGPSGSLARAAQNLTPHELGDRLKRLLDDAGRSSSAEAPVGLGPSVGAALGVRSADGAVRALRGEGQFLERRTAGGLSYKLYLPNGLSKGAPLILMLHGCNQSPDDFAVGTRMNLIADEQKFVVAYPGQSQSANAMNCWNWFEAQHQNRDAGEPHQLALLTRELANEFAVDRRRVYIAGLSAGGAAAAVMGSIYPDLFAAIGVHSGLACGAATDLRSAMRAMQQGAMPPLPKGGGSAAPAIVFHGDRDATVHVLNADHLVAQAKPKSGERTLTRNGQSEGGVKWTCTLYCDASGRARVENWLLHGAGHAWSGGSSKGSFTDPRGPDASREMVRFFLTHRLAESRG